MESFEAIFIPKTLKTGWTTSYVRLEFLFH